MNYLKLANIFLFLNSIVLSSQTVNTDPGVTGAVIANDVRRRAEHSSIIDEQKRIISSQILITANLEQLRMLNERAQNSLKNVQSIIRDSKKIVEIGEITKDIFDYQKAIVEEASGDLKLTAIAIKSQQRAGTILSLLAVDISNATKGGKNFRFSNSDRLNILNNALLRLRQIRGFSYGLLRKFKYASGGRFLRKLLEEYRIDDIYRTLNRAEMVNRSLPNSLNGVLRVNNESSTNRPNGNPDINEEAKELLRNNHPVRVSGQARTNAKDIYNDRTEILYQTESTYAIDEDGDGIVDFEVDRETIDNHVINSKKRFNYDYESTRDFLEERWIDRANDNGFYEIWATEELFNEILIFSNENNFLIDFLGRDFKNGNDNKGSILFIDEYGHSHTLTVEEIVEWNKFI